MVVGLVSVCGPLSVVVGPLSMSMAVGPVGGCGPLWLWAAVTCICLKTATDNSDVIKSRYGIFTQRLLYSNFRKLVRLAKFAK